MANKGSRDSGSLRRIDPFRWEIPIDHRPGMRVPGLIYADETLLESIANDQAVEQVANVATLPGIVGRSLAMPDIHWGYGFPIGGVAATRALDGVISPGGIGYDICCLPGEARVLHPLGYHRPITDFAGRWSCESVTCVDAGGTVRSTDVVGFLEKAWADHDVLRITTEAGREIRATADHPFLTPTGMVPLGSIEAGDRVAVHPFEGVPYEEPGDDLLVDEEDLAAAYPGPTTGLTQLVRTLRDRELLPLTLDHPKLPYLIKLMAFIQGDGCLTFHRAGGSQIAC